MQCIIHDLRAEVVRKFWPVKNGDHIIAAEREMKRCVGCFGCWIKTPGQCVLEDEFSDLGRYIAEADSVVVISRCVYGCVSLAVKAVLDRSISYVHPFFVVRGGRVHHRPRYQKRKPLIMVFYGKDISSKEKETARDFAKAVGINWNAEKVSTKFICGEEK